MGNPSNAKLDEAIDRYGHLNISGLTYRPPLVTIAFPTCDEYATATRIASKKPHDGGRLLGATRSPFRVYDHIDNDGHLLEHRCWPHMSCWSSESSSAPATTAGGDSDG